MDKPISEVESIKDEAWERFWADIEYNAYDEKTKEYDMEYLKRSIGSWIRHQAKKHDQAITSTREEIREDLLNLIPKDEIVCPDCGFEWETHADEINDLIAKYSPKK
jgi:hypothetical protein